ncbi:MAG: hypothetical protein IT452_08890 [Planctomycetia bacterium]|nr:hypothetical protein [Planctomycetia bacterium]
MRTAAGVLGLLILAAGCESKAGKSLRGRPARGAFPPEVEAVALEFVAADGQAVEDVLPLVHALAVAGSAESLRRLEALAAPDPDGGVGGGADPGWTESLEALRTRVVGNHEARKHDRAAWIRAALKARR